MTTGLNGAKTVRALAGAALLGGAITLAGTAALAQSGDKVLSHIDQVPHVISDIIDKDGKKIGTVDLYGGNSGVVIHIEAAGLAPGAHGMHFHMVGECDDGNDFMSAGEMKGHEGGDASHGKMHGEGGGHHEGALPNLIVRDDGTVIVELYSTTVSMREGEFALLDADGASIVIHENPDDHLSEYDGGSGPRIACAVIKG